MQSQQVKEKNMKNNPLPRLDADSELRAKLLPYCRLSEGDVWEDPETGHRVACGDATDQANVIKLLADEKASLAIQDPPYNLVAFERAPIDDFIHWCESWVKASVGANTWSGICNGHGSIYAVLADPQGCAEPVTSAKVGSLTFFSGNILQVLVR